MGEAAHSNGRSRSAKGSRASRPRDLTAVAFPSFEAAVAFIHDHVNVERTRPEKIPAGLLKLDRMEALLELLGNPHRAAKFVHVAGSKGKGSVCEMTAACLKECGYTTGLYTSPHLVDIRERIRINGELISREDFVRHAGLCAAAAAEAEKKHGPATFFELLTAIALNYFAEQAVDIAVVEVGLGGRLDSTNVITPEVAAITSIQLEHTQILGDTLEKIAAEKAGIIKNGAPVITIPQQTEGVINVFRDAALAKNTAFRIVGQDIDFTSRFGASPELGPHARVCMSTERSEFEHLVVPLKGEHQAYNCGLALAILDALRARGMDTPERKVAAGLAKTPNHGRLELVSNSPRIVVDGAHNPESIQQLMRSLGMNFRADSLVVIFGCASDKNAVEMLRRLAGGADKIIFTRAADNARAMDPRELHRKFVDISHKFSQTAPNLKEALNTAARAVNRGDLICVTGSFYLAGEAKRLLREREQRIAGAGLPVQPGPKSQAQPAPAAKPAHRRTPPNA